MIVFSMGQFGWSLTGFGVANLLNYYYFPPILEGSPVFPVRIFQGAVIGILTILGLATFFGRAIDAVSDPLIATWSDRIKLPFGRRRIFLLSSALPTAILSVFVFIPPVPGESTINSVYIIILLIVFYISITAYIIPYGALISELGHTAKQRLKLATFTSVAWAVGFFVGNSVYALKDVFLGMGMTGSSAFVATLIIFAVIGFIAMMMPVLFIDERRFCHRGRSDENPVRAVRTALKNSNFKIVLWAQFAYFISTTILEIGIVYYVTLLMGLPESMAFTLMGAMFIFSFVLYPFVVKLTIKIGRKKMFIAAFFSQIFVFGLLPLSGIVPVPSAVWGWITILIQAVPCAIFGIVPTAVIADIAKADGIETGNNKEAIFFGINSFVMKIGISMANLIFPSLLLLGRSVDNNLGVRLAPVAALLASVAGVIFIFKFNETKLNTILEVELEEEMELNHKK